jgi:hypothetical protein
VSSEHKASAISSPAAQPEPDIRVESELYVKFEDVLYRFCVCFTHDTVSVLFGKVLEKIQCRPSPSKIFFLRIGGKFWKQIGGKSWKQEDAESTTTTLSKAGCCGKDLTLQADDREVVLIPLTIAIDGLPSLQVHVNLFHTSPGGLAALAKEHLVIPVDHFIFGTNSLFSYTQHAHESLHALGIAEDSTLVAVFGWTEEAARQQQPRQGPR